MRKVTTINLNNNAYQIDEDGYETLHAYLARAERALAGNPDREEIISDLEQAIADKCRLALGPHKSVVSESEIERILAEMGPVAGGTDEAAPDTAHAAAGDANAEPAQAPPGYRPRRLYRIREGQRWAGICQGLAAFAGIDVTFVRIVVVLLTIFTGFFPGVLVYIVLCFLIPVATTPEEVSAAYGQPFRAQEVVDRVKKKHGEWRSARRDRHWMKHAARPPHPAAAATTPGYAARVTGGIILPVLTLISAVWFAVLATAAYVIWSRWGQAGNWGWGFGFADGHSDIPRWVALAVVLAVYAVLAIPLAAARRASLYYANGGRTHGWADAWSGLLWLAVVGVLLLIAWFLMPQAEEMMRHQFRATRGLISL